MAGTMDQPFLESAAKCSVCLDLKKDHLRRQWRQFGRLPALDASYSVTIKKIEENAKSTACDGCGLIHNAVQEIKKEFSLDFRNAILEYIDKNGQEGLSLILTMLHPLHTDEGDWERAQANPDLKTSVHTGPTTDTSKRQWEYKISSPKYEIFTPDSIQQDKTATTTSSEDAMCDAIQTAEHTLWDSILPRPARCGNTGGDEAVNWTRSALMDCSHFHTSCGLEGSKSVLPTRVLDLKVASEDRYTADIRLYVTKREEKPYLCLSHCWGADRGSMPLATTFENLDEFQRRIPWASLTKSFQEAVIFTRKLGYRYLWIDSLCIVQNDIEDWMREAGEMAGIYENAVLTLAAASSENSNGGLFRPSTTGIRLNDDMETREILLRRFSNPEFFDYRSSGEGQDVDHVSPLLRRAWVFQERMLSRRVLFFTPLELVFECRNSNLTESGYSWADSVAKRAFEKVFGKDDADATELPDLWRSLVNDFTQLRLTMHKDTLPAMAGMAKRFQQLRKSDETSYHAGLWKDTFIEDLLWETPVRVVRPRKVVNSGIPTWSWARTGDPKKYEKYPNILLLSNVEEVRCKLGGQMENLFTGVDSGHAILSGYLLPAKSTSSGMVINRNPRVSHIPLRDYDWYEEGPTKIQDGDDLYILPLAATTDGEGEARIHSLVLRRYSGDGDVFVRIGIFHPSIYHLRHHEYIFEGRDTLFSLYQEDVGYGESLLGEDGLYKKSGDRDGKPIYLTSKTDRRYKMFESRAWFLYLCKYGHQPETEYRKFLGQPHLDVLKKATLDEKERAREWRRRDEGEEGQQRKRILIRVE